MGVEIKCPGCDDVKDEDDVLGQMDHMKTNHQDIIDERLSSSGFVKSPYTGKWLDVWSSD